MQIRPFSHCWVGLHQSNRKYSNIFCTYVAICLEFLNDPFNSQQAHQTACKVKESSASSSSNTIALINYAVFLYNSDHEENKDRIIELLMEFEKCWLKRKSNSSEFDDNIMKTATMLAAYLNLAGHLAWMKQIKD